LATIDKRLNFAFICKDLQEGEKTNLRDELNIPSR